MQVAMTIAFALMLGAAQAPADVRQLFDSGRYQDVVKANDQAAPDNERTSRLRYLTAQSYAKLNDGDAARRTYQRLAESGASPWASIGKSAVQLMDKQLDQSLESANQAVRAGDSLPEAHYQRGIVLMSKTEYGEAAGAFARATQLDPTFAAAHYYGGLANYRAKRIDLMTNSFEAFVKLAPNAPERQEVEAILRTVRGR
jgi:tetratricopeptide (TPR) repeat protein